MHDDAGEQEPGLDFLAAVAHEFKTPLTLIQGMGSMLGSQTHGELNTAQREQVHHIQQSSRRLATLVDSLLHVEGLPYKYATRPLQLRHELSVVLEDAQPLATERAITLTTRMRSVPPVLMDAPSFYFAFGHIIGLALRLSPSESTVTVQLRRRQQWVMVEVRAPTEFVRPQQRQRLRQQLGHHKQPFRHLSNFSGVSWFVAQSIVEFYRGSIDVRNYAGSSKITAHLPMSQQISLFDDIGKS